MTPRGLAAVFALIFPLTAAAGETAVKDDCRYAEGEAAIAPCRAALEADRGDLESGFKLAWALLGHNRESDGIAIFRQLAEEHPEDRRTHFNLAGALASVSAYTDAKAPIARALDLAAMELEIQKLAAAIYLNTKDYAQAHEMHLKLAGAGLRTSMFDLAEDYALGRGVRYDQAEARRWYQAAAEAGHVGAMTVLAAKLESGAFGDPRDPAGAAYWRQQAADAARGLPGWD